MSRKSIIVIFIAAITSVLCGCRKHMSLEEKAVHDAKEYNRRYCPTPPINYISTDSIGVVPDQHLFIYYCSFCDKLDNPEIVALNQGKIVSTLTASIKESTALKTYVESGYHFKYICHSKSHPQEVLFEVAF